MAIAIEKRVFMLNLSFTELLKKEIDIPIYIGGASLVIRLDSGFFSPADKTYAGLHNHSVCEVHLVLDGNHTIFIHNRFYSIKAGDICFISPGIYHYYGKLPEKPSQIRTFKLILPSVPTVTSEAENVTSALTENMFAVFSDNFSSMSFVPEILSELDQKPVGFYTNVQALFMKIIVNIVRSVAQPQLTDYHIRDRIPEEIRNELIDSFFYHNYNQSVSADDLADVVRISRRQLHRVLKDIYNLSFKQKLIEIRIEKAKDLLQNTNIQVDKVAELVGYQLPANFYLIFKKTVGLSPGLYRLRYKNAMTISEVQ